MKRAPLLILVFAGLAAAAPAGADAATRKPPAAVGTAITVQLGIGILVPGPAFGSDARVKRLLGKPDRPGRRTEGFRGISVPVSLDYRKKYGLLLYFDHQREGAPLGTVAATSRRFRTNEGVRVGDKVSDFRRAYPGPESSCGRTVRNRRVCSIRESQASIYQPGGANFGGTMEDTTFEVLKSRIIQISVSSRIR